MNSRWREYEYYYQINDIRAEVELDQQAAKAKKAAKQDKTQTPNLKTHLVKSIMRLRQLIFA